MYNRDIAAIFNTIADLLEIKNENPFRIRAYRNAARVIGGLNYSIEQMVLKNEDLTEIPGIGKDLAQKITTIVETGSLPLLKDLTQEIPMELTQLVGINGLGPKRIHTLYQQLHIKNSEDLKEAIKRGEIRHLQGFGEKTEKEIQKGLEELSRDKKRMKLSHAHVIAEDIVNVLKKVKGVYAVVIAGSYRRNKETVGDLDVLVTCNDSSSVMEQFIHSGIENKVLSYGKTKSSIRLLSGLQVDLRVVSKESYGAALHYFTGSQAHNIEIRKRAAKYGLKINEYGVFKNEERIGGKEEVDIFRSVGLPFIAPELREGQGEIEAAEKGALPQLVNRSEIKGDLHVHSNYSDGTYSIKQMAEAAQKCGYEYIAITDHSQRIRIAHGLDEPRLRKQWEEIDALNDTMKGFTILKGAEVDILADGTLDYPDYILKELDLTVCSIHSKFKLSMKEQTRRISIAMDNPYFTIFGHPTGRIINGREPYIYDKSTIFSLAVTNNKIIEINANPDRLDLNGEMVRVAKEHGVLFSIGTDAHGIHDFSYIALGIGQARRGWLTKDNVVNTRNQRELLKLLKLKNR